MTVPIPVCSQIILGFVNDLYAQFQNNLSTDVKLKACENLDAKTYHIQNLKYSF
jgi:hypothetical protein